MQLETSEFYLSSQILQSTGTGTDATFRALALSMVSQLQQSNNPHYLIKQYAATSPGNLNSQTLETLSKLNLGNPKNHQTIYNALVPKLKKTYTKNWLKAVKTEGKDNGSFKLLEHGYATWEANPESDLNLGPLSAIRQDILKQFQAVKKKIHDAQSAYHQNNRFLPADKKQKIKQRILLSAWKNGWILNGLSGKLAKANTKYGRNPGHPEDLQRWAQNTLGTQDPATFQPSESGEIHARIVVRNSSDAAALISEEALVAQLCTRNEFGQPNGNPFMAFRPFATPAQMTRLINRIVEHHKREYPDTQTAAPSRVIERQNVDQLLHQINARRAEQSAPVQLSSQGLGTVSRQTNIVPILKRLHVKRVNKKQFRTFKTEPNVARDMVTVALSQSQANTISIRGGTFSQQITALKTALIRNVRTIRIVTPSALYASGTDDEKVEYDQLKTLLSTRSNMTFNAYQVAIQALQSSPRTASPPPAPTDTAGTPSPIPVRQPTPAREPSPSPIRPNATSSTAPTTTTRSTGAESSAAQATHMPRLLQTSPVSSDSFSAEAGSLSSVSMHTEESSTSAPEESEVMKRFMERRQSEVMKRFMERRQKARGRSKSTSSGKIEPIAKIMPMQKEYRHSNASSVAMQGLDMNFPTASTEKSYSMRPISEALRASIISQLTSPASQAPTVDSQAMGEALAAHRELMQRKKPEIASVRFTQPVGEASEKSGYLQRLREYKANQEKRIKMRARPCKTKHAPIREQALHKSPDSLRR